MKVIICRISGKRRPVSGNEQWSSGGNAPLNSGGLLMVVRCISFFNFAGMNRLLQGENGEADEDLLEGDSLPPEIPMQHSGQHAASMGSLFTLSALLRRILPVTVSIL